MKTRYNLPYSKGTFLCFCQTLLLTTISLLPGRCQVAEWTFENIASSVPGLPITASYSIPQVTAAATLAGGNNNGSPDACSGAETWSTNFWPTGNIRAEDEYLEFVLTAHPGESIEVSYFSFSSSASSSSSALQYDVFYSDDDFVSATQLLSGSHSIGSCTMQGAGLSASIVPGAPLRFRIYPYGQNIAAQAATIRLDNVSLSGAVLPVSLVNFSADRHGDVILVRWATATELNNDFFAVERSPDGLSFSEIGRVQGTGTLQTLQHYQFTDQHPLTGENYYRLQQVDLDGKAHLHEVVQVNFSEQAGSGIKIWPTVSSSEIRIEMGVRPKKPVPFTIHSTLGPLLKTGLIGPQSVRLDLPIQDLPAGSYIFRVTAGDQLHVARFVRQ